MWIFTEIGFFSVVRGDDEDGVPTVMVRARVRDDLVSLLECYGDELEPAPILEWPGRDYPYRVIMARDEWAKILLALGMELDYPNFKNRVAQVSGAMRAQAYGAVWSVMLRLEEKLGIRERNRSIYG